MKVEIELKQMRPKPPECRIEYDSIFGRRMFSTETAFNQWKAQPWWKRLFT